MRQGSGHGEVGQVEECPTKHVLSLCFFGRLLHNNIFISNKFFLSLFYLVSDHELCYLC